MSVTLNDATSALGRIAPLEYAESWDRVGLLIEPFDERWAERHESPWNDPIVTGCGKRPIRRIMLTIDLTEAVLDEAIGSKTDLIVAYHPPIFDPIERFRVRKVKERIAMRAIAAKIAVYSPHTALDAAPGGVGDWLAGGLGDDASISPLDSRPVDTDRCKLVVFVPADHADRLRDALANECGAGVIGDYTHCSFNTLGNGTFLGGEASQPTVGKKGRLEQVKEIRMEMVCQRGRVSHIASVIGRVHPYEEPAWEVYPLVDPPEPAVGVAKRVTLKSPVTIKTLVTRIKKHLGLKRVRLASPPSHDPSHKINHVAVCPGAGGSVFADQWGPQVYLTGEMRHHDVLAKVEQGATVILTDHTNTERGYLPTLKKKLQDELGQGVAIDISKVDADPLRIV